MRNMRMEMLSSRGGTTEKVGSGNCWMIRECSRSMRREQILTAVCVFPPVPPSAANAFASKLLGDSKFGKVWRVLPNGILVSVMLFSNGTCAHF